MTTDFDKKLSHVHRSSGTTKAIDGVGPDTGLDTMAEVWKSLEGQGWQDVRSLQVSQITDSDS